MRMLARVTLIVVVALVAGCGSDEPSARPWLSEPIKYEVIGGDAFRDDTITVRPDGRASIQTRAGTRSANLTAAELSALRRGIDAADLAGVENAVTEPPIPDALSYRVTYRGHQVTTDTGKLPDDLRPLVGTFNDLIERYGA